MTAGWKRPIGRGLCVLGWHDYRWVGFRWVHDTPATAWGHDHECARCGNRIDLGDRGLEPLPLGPSEDYQELLRGEIEADEYVRRLKATVDRRLARGRKSASTARSGPPTDTPHPVSALVQTPDESRERGQR